MISHASNKTGTIAAPESHGAKAPSCRTEILVRLWTRFSEANKLHPDETASKRQGAIAFIEDVIGSRKGALTSTDEGLFVSVLESPSDALVASRQILLGIQSFQDKSGDQPVSVSISIDANSKNVASDEASRDTQTRSVDANPRPAPQASHDLLSLIRISRPAQVLLTHDMCQQANPFKGLPLKPFQGRFGVSEYLWTSEDKLLECQNQQSGFVDLIAIEKVEKAAPQSPPVEPSGAAIDTFFEPRAKTPFDGETSQAQGWKGALRTPWAIAAGVLILVIAIAVAFMLRGGKPAPVAQSNVNQVPNPVSPATPKTTEPPPSTTIKKNTQQKLPVASVAETAGPAHQDQSKKRTGNDSAKAVSVPALPKAECKLPGDLQSYVRLAEGYRGHGQYDDARRVFTQILACDPNNQDARKGLERTLAAQAPTSQ